MAKNTTAETVREPQAVAKLRLARISPRKVQIVLDLIRNQPVDVALAALDLTPKAACPIVKKLLCSAIANADNNHSMNKDALYVASCNVGPGPILKRIQPRAHGRAFRINKRTSNITIILKEREA